MSIRSTLFRVHRSVVHPGPAGLPVAALRGLLELPTAAYGAGVRARNLLYRWGFMPARRVGVPVLSVGNITAGGTGKTPLVAWVARLMVIHNMRPVILSRGYGRHPRTGIDDENALLARLVGDVPIVVDPDRVRGARRAVAEHGANVLILDDGFQHRRIARDLDLVLVDALQPFGGERLLPRGLLREPLGELRRAGAFVMSRADLIPAEELEGIKARLARLAPRRPVACCRTAPTGLRGLAGAGDLPLGALLSGTWGAFCGIGSPDGFRLTLERAGCRPVFFAPFADHEPYSPGQIERLLTRARELGCTGLVTTGKDAVKVEPLLGGRAEPPVHELAVETECTEGAAPLTAAILAALGKTP